MSFILVFLLVFGIVLFVLQTFVYGGKSNLFQQAFQVLQQTFQSFRQAIQPAPQFNIPQPIVGIPCDKCKQSNMVQDRIYRTSGCLVAIGYFLVVPGILLMLGGIACPLVMLPLSQVDLSQTRIERMRELTEKSMRESGISPKVADEYHSTGNVSQDTIRSLSEFERNIVIRIMQGESARMGRDSTRSPEAATRAAAGATVCGGVFSMGTFLVGLPAFIVGFLLILKRSVWRCPTCNYIFDRA